ncbi:MAG: hypothetical protein QXW80_06955 [Candidatus Micrarchaeia archaeon]
MDTEKLKKVGKHILLAFCGIVFFTSIGYVLTAANSYFSGVPNHINSYSFGNTLYFLSIIFIIITSIDSVFILLEPFGADSLIHFIMEYF